mgnify:CR=1 FL=1
MATLKRFQHLMKILGGSSSPDEIFAEIEKRYQEPHRHYHNLNHVSQCLQEFDRVRNLANDPPIVELAIWFHDAVYDTHRKDNEAQSARLAETLLARLGIGQEVMTRVADFILMTRHLPGTFPPDGQLLVDLDISILGAPRPLYKQYSEAIRKEFHWVSDAEYRVGRGQVLNRFLARESLYHTEHYRSELETRAQRNIQSEISLLERRASLG